MVKRLSRMIDTHAHIYVKEFKDDLNDVIEKSTDMGLKKILMPNIDNTSIEPMLEVEQKYPHICHAMMGLHPSSVKKGFEKQLYEVEEWLARRKFLAVGEIGIDLYWDKQFEAHQKEAFEIQIKWAKELNLPIVIHCREAFEETISIVEALHEDGLTGVFHCFTGSIEEAERIMKLGFYLGIGGVATFKNGGLDKVLPQIDLSKIVLETDSPYLAPMPKRGKRNEPSYLPLIAQRIADIKSIPLEEIRKTTSENAKALFKMN